MGKRKHNRLTSVEVKTLQKPGLYADGGNLYLQVSEAGTKSWVFRYAIAGRSRDMGLGSAASIDLKLARELAKKQRAVLVEGDDPIDVRRAKREAAIVERANRTTFRSAANDFMQVHADTWTSDRHRHQWTNTLKQYAYPHIGDRPIEAIDARIINECVQPIWHSTPVTAGRVKQRIARVVQWVKDGKPLPKPAGAVNHHQAVAIDEIPAFMDKLRSTIPPSPAPSRLRSSAPCARRKC
jgi:Arm DNA-binding domain